MDYSLDESVTDAINEWYRSRAYIYDNNFLTDNGSELETLPQTIEKVIIRYNAQLICVDNLMTAMETVSEQSNLYLAQSNFVGRLKAIAMKYSVVIILVALTPSGFFYDMRGFDSNHFGGRISHCIKPGSFFFIRFFIRTLV